MPIDDRLRHQSTDIRKTRPILRVAAFNVGSSAVDQSDHDLSNEFFCSPAMPVDGGTSNVATDRRLSSSRSRSTTIGSANRSAHTKGLSKPQSTETLIDFGNPFLPDFRTEPKRESFDDFLNDGDDAGSDVIAGAGHSNFVQSLNRRNAAIPNMLPWLLSSDSDLGDGHQGDGIAREPLSWPEIHQFRSATARRVPRRLMSEDVLFSRRISTMPRLYRPRVEREWNTSDSGNAGDTLNRRSNVDFTNIGAAQEQPGTSSSRQNAECELDNKAIPGDVHIIVDNERGTMQSRLSNHGEAIRTATSLLGGERSPDTGVAPGTVVSPVPDVPDVVDEVLTAPDQQLYTLPVRSICEGL